MEIVLGALTGLAISLILQHCVTRGREKRREKFLQEYRQGHVNTDNATCSNLRAAGWSEERIRAWCNNSRCVYYSPEYNSTDL